MFKKTAAYLINNIFLNQVHIKA